MVWRAGGANARRLFVSPLSTFCNSWRNEFNYNRAVSNRNEFVENSRCAKYTASGSRRRIIDAVVAFASTPGYRLTGAQPLPDPETRQCARAYRASVCGATKRNRRVWEWESDTRRLLAWRRRALHFAIRANPHFRPGAKSGANRGGPPRVRPTARRIGANEAANGALYARGVSITPARAPRIGRNVACPRRPAPAMFTISPRSPRNWPLCIPGPANSFTARFMNGCVVKPS
jgi:hypothetical protein